MTISPISPLSFYASQSKQSESPRALDKIFANDPEVVAFGEIHREDTEEPLNFHSTAQYFAQYILPFLPAHGIRDIVVEFLPDDPIIDVELAAYMETGELSNKTPHINNWIEGPDRCGFLAFLRSARDNGITIHGGHLSLAEAPDAFDVASIVARDPEGTARLVGQHTLRQIRSVLKEGRRVASFGGMRHNNYNPLPEDLQASYGDELYVQLGRRYVEVDLLVPELAPYSAGQIGLDNWERYVPEEGLNYFDQKQRYLIIFPRTPNIRQLTYPEIQSY
jgi:hypothetical protein